MSELRVLLVEDSECDQFLFKLVFEECQPKGVFVQANDGQEALTLLEQSPEPPSLIFLDLNMPRMSGFEFLEAGQDVLVRHNVQVYITSSSNRQVDRQKALSFDCVKGYLEKPLSVEAMVKILSGAG